MSVMTRTEDPMGTTTKLNPEPCSRLVPTRGLGGYFSHQCKCKIWKDGFCKTHHPDTVADRQAKSEARFKASSPYEALKRAYDRITALESEVAALKQGRQTPEPSAPREEAMESVGAGAKRRAESAWRVPRQQSTFGTWLDVPHSGEPVIVLYRGSHGWCTPEGLGHVLLSHQVYTERLSSVARYPTLEIVVVGLKSARWVTVWAEDDRNVSCPHKPVEDAPDSGGMSEQRIDNQ